MKDSLTVIVGPTAAGKSDIGIQVAKVVGGEIISGDSVQVYRKLDIGSAKVVAEQQQGVPHHMIDILDPAEEFSVAMFQERVRELVRQINNRGKIPILVGGTGLYIRSVLDPYEFPSVEEDRRIRAELHRLVDEMGPSALHKLLAEVDPESAARLHPNDIKRVVRALEVYRLTGEKFSAFQHSVSREPRLEDSPFRLSYFALTAPREIIYRRINTRVDAMLEHGLLEEISGLLAEGYAPSFAALQTIGYRHGVQYLRGFLSRDEMTRLMKRDTRHFAKRQLTWFRRDQRITWFDVTRMPPEQIIAQMVERICSA